MFPDRLYFHRASLASQVVTGFEHQLQISTTLFAPRRKGKTMFLLRDLQPEAERRGFLVAYADLWSNKDNPELVICESLARALHETSLIDKLRLWWAQPKRQMKGLKIGVGIDSASAEAELAEAGIPRIHNLFERFRFAGKGKALLIVDEIQHLATRPAFESLTATLRSLLTTSQGEVFAVFTGSSQDGLTNMFRRSKAPFFQFGSQINFPDLGVELAKHFGALYRDTTGKEWETDLAFRLYVARGMTPYYLRTLFTTCLEQGLSVREADAIVWAGMVDEGQFATLLSELPPLDQLLLRGIITGDSLYSEEYRKRIAMELPGGMTPSTQQVQGGLERLRKRELVANLGHGAWAIEEDALAAYLHRHYSDEASAPQ